jgi:HPt (histidine-containing phosphotransfer) domain-containing protein
MAQESIMTHSGISPYNGEGETHWVLPDVLVDLASDGSPGLITDLIAIFQTDLQPRLRQVRRALSDSDRKAFSAAIHSIKGAAQQIGADAMASICLDIEQSKEQLSEAQLRERLNGLESEFEGVCRAMAAYSDRCSSSFM